MSVSPTFTANYWRERAYNARAQAAQLYDANARKVMLDNAKSYDLLADRAEKTAAGKPVTKGKS